VQTRWPAEFLGNQVKARLSALRMRSGNEEPKVLLTPQYVAQHQKCEDLQSYESHAN